MSQASRPDLDTARMWMSALIDGELEEAELTQLHQMLQAHPELQGELQQMRALFGADVSRFDTSNDASNDTSNDAPALADAICAAVAPAQVRATGEGASRLASLDMDGELNVAGQTHLRDLARQPEIAAGVQSFLHASAAIQQANGELAKRDQGAPAGQAALAAIAQTQHQGELIAAFADGETQVDREEVAAALAALSTSPAANGELARLRSGVQVSRAAQVVLRAPAEHPAITPRLAAQAASVSAQVEGEARAGLLSSALLDGELSAAEENELQVLLRTDGDGYRAHQARAFVDCTEVTHVALQALTRDPAGAKAGEAALLAIAAIAANERAQEASQKAKAPAGWLAQMRERLAAFMPSSVLPSMLAAAAAAAFFVNFSGPPADPTPPAAHHFDWQAALLAAALPNVVSQETASSNQSEMPVLADNSATEVQALESDTSTTLIFTTDATHMTVIWVPEEKAIEPASTLPQTPAPLAPTDSTGETGAEAQRAG